MEILRNKDNTVSKFIHKDGSETAIKVVKSIVNEKENDNLSISFEDRNKYSIFISVSRGCQFKCSFCYLTLKNSQYNKLTKENILNNLKEAFLEELSNNPSIVSIYIKLSWMVMGDAFNQPLLVKDTTIEFLEWIFENKYAKGLDGVDLSTIFPNNVQNDWKSIYHSLNDYLYKYNFNPANNKKDNIDLDFSNSFEYDNRSPFRIFYSLGTAIQENKNNIIPGTKNTVKAIIELLDYSENNKYNVLLHHMFIEGLNSSENDIRAFLDLYSKIPELKKIETRILRYNFCDLSKYKEEEDFNNIINQILPNVPNLKVQISAGSEVKAACGQFIVKVFK